MSDRPRIYDTLGRCFFAYDHGDGETMANCFVDDGEIVVTIEGQGQVDTVSGRAAIAEFCRKSFASRTGPSRHLVSNSFVEEDGNEDAVVVSYHTTVATVDGTPVVVQTGWCRDRFLFEENGWKIVSRAYHCDSAL